MVTSASPAARDLLEGAILLARRILESDLQKVLEGRFGIHRNGRIEDEGSLRLSPHHLANRRDVEEVLKHFVAEGESADAAVEHLLREASFTHLNRLVAIRIAESIGLIPQALAAGRSSRGFKELLEIAPVLSADQWGGYWQFLKLCGDELAGDASVLFGPRNPLLTVEPSPSAVDELVSLFSRPDLEGVWSAADALGWTYQFFNSSDERKAMKEAASAPRNSRELAILNQFFTPRYVVDYLVQNTLGRRLLEMGESPDLLDAMPLLVDPPETKTREPDLSGVRVLDPACGSGHFLLGAYDLLEIAWELNGVAPAEAASRILPCLWGVDIDARCAQVASAALILRARRSASSGPLPQPNIITARPLPDDPVVWEKVLSHLAPEHRQVVRVMSDALKMAPVLGPLLKIGEQLVAAVAGAVPELAGGSDGLFAVTQEAADAVSGVDAILMRTLATVAASAASSATERLFSAEAHDAIRFIEAMRHRYDAVLMNPPFGAEVPSAAEYLRTTYAEVGADVDLFAAFVVRGLSLTRPGGYVGAITSRTGLFLSSFEKWRRTVLMSGRLITLADLGQGVMAQAMVEAAAYVLTFEGSQSREPSILRLLTSSSQEEDLKGIVAESRAGHDSKLMFRPQFKDLTSLPSAPLAYWVDPHAVVSLRSHSPFQPNFGQIRQGLSTGDDFRFIRAWWEVPSKGLTTAPHLSDGLDSRAQLRRGRRWAPIVKGGASQPWFSPILMVVDWQNDGERLRGFTDAGGRQRSAIRSPEMYFRPGFSWTRRAPRLIPYVVPAGCIPSTSRYQAYPRTDPYAALGLAASNIATAFCRFYAEQFQRPNFLVDNVKAIPIAELDIGLSADLADTVRERTAERREMYTHVEPFREFAAPARTAATGSWDPRTLLGRQLEDRVAAAYGLSPEQSRSLETDMREALAVQKWASQEETADDELREGSNVVSYGQAMLSYLVGVAFGRWDLRIGLDTTRAPVQADVFAEMAASPPGALVDADGLPAVSAPGGYPVQLPPDRLLLDEPGNEWDVEGAVLRALSAYSDQPETLLTEVMSDVRQGDLRAYLRREFFRDHLQVYTAGHRKAPIYWQLALPSRRWGIWIYAPTLGRETLFAIARHADRRLETARDQLAFQNSSRSRDLRSASEAEVAAMEALVDELAVFAAEALRIAEIGWEPDLNDGLILCAAPMAGLFPGWPDLQREREKLRNGLYEWATVSRWGRQL